MHFDAKLSPAFFPSRKVGCLATTSLLVLPCLLSSATWADQFSADVPYISITGGYFFNDSQENFSVDRSDARVDELEPLEPGSDAMFAAVSMGQELSKGWSWRATAQALSTREASSKTHPDAGSIDKQWATNDLDLLTLDLDIGYELPAPVGVDLRLYAGPRVMHATNKIDYGYEGEDKLGSFESRYEHYNAVSAVGARLGVDAVLPVEPSGPRLAGSISGSALYGSFNNHLTVEGTGQSGGRNHVEDGWIYNLEASAAVQFDLSEISSIELGYRAQQWWDLLESVEDAQGGAGDYSEGSRSDLLVHGPYVTFKLKLGSKP